MYEESHVKRPKSLRALYVSIFLFRMGFGQILVALPLYLTLLGAGASSVGVVAAANPIAEILLAIPAGRLSDRVGRKRVIGAGLIAGTVIFFCYPFTTSLIVVGFLHLCLGMSEAAIIAPSMALVTDKDPKRLGMEFGFMSAATTLGYVVGPVFSGLLFEKSHSLPFIMSGLGALLAFLILLLFLEEGRMASRREVLPFGKLLGHRPLWLILCLWVVAMALLSVLMTFSPLYLRSLGITPSSIGTLLGMSTVMLVLSLLVFGWLSDKFAQRKLVAFSFFALSVSLFGFSLADEYVLIVPFVVILGIGGGAFTPAATSWLARMGARFSRGTLMGLYDVVIATGNAAGPLLAGLVVKIAGFSGVFLLFGVLSLAAALLAISQKEESRP